jgi:DNA-binding IclR family transcriptional regulator
MSWKSGAKMTKPKNDATGTQLLDRAVAMLTLLGEAGQAGARTLELGEQLNLTTPTTHRIIAALERHGLVEREASTRRYRLGLALFSLGAKAADGTGLRTIARPSLIKLAAETGDTVFLMARSGLNVVCVDRQEGTYFLDSLTGHVGGQIPMGVGSASQALLAFLPAAEAEAIIDANDSAYGRFGKLDAKHVREQLTAIRERGYAIDHGNLVEGISAIAVPVLTPGRDVVAAFAINMTSSRLSPDRIEPLATLLKDEVIRISSNLNPMEYAARNRRSY